MARPCPIRWHLAPGFALAELLALLQRGERSAVKEAPHRGVFRAVLGGLDVHVKHYAEGRGRLFRACRARREFETTREVARRGVPTPQALAWGEDAKGSYLVTRTLPRSRNLIDVLAGPVSPSLRQALAVGLGAFLARAHAAGVRHDDLHPGNLLVALEGQAFEATTSLTAGPRAFGHGENTALTSRRVALFLIDLDAVRLGPPLPWPAARDNLVVLNRWFLLRFSRADRLRAWCAYSREADFADKSGGARDLEERTRVSLIHFTAGLDRRCLGGNRHFRRLAAPGVRGYAVDGVELSGLLRDPDAAIASSPTLKRSASSAVVEVAVPVGGAAHPAVLKRVSATAWTDPLAALFRAPAALHAYRMAHALRLRGLPTPRALAVWHRRRFGLPADGYLLLERVPDALDVGRFVESLEGDPAGARERLRKVSDQLARLIARMHGWNLSHRDLKSANVLVSPLGWVMGYRGLCEAEVGGGDHVWFVDLAGVRQMRRLGEERKARDLARLNVSFLGERAISRGARLRFLLAYLGRQAKDWRRWWRRIEGQTAAKVERNRRNDRVLG